MAREAAYQMYVSCGIPADEARQAAQHVSQIGASDSRDIGCEAVAEKRPALARGEHPAETAEAQRMRGVAPIDQAQPPRAWQRPLDPVTTTLREPEACRRLRRDERGGERAFRMSRRRELEQTREVRRRLHESPHVEVL